MAKTEMSISDDKGSGMWLGNCRGNPRVGNALPLPLPSLYPYPPPRAMRVEGFLEGYRLIISAFTFTVTYMHIRHITMKITTIDYYHHCTSINDRTITIDHH